MSNKTHAGEVDEQLVMSDSVNLSIGYEVLKIAKCDGENTHYYWRIDGAGDHDTSDCFPSMAMAMADANEQIETMARSAVTETP